LYQADFCSSNGVILGEIGQAVVEIMAPGRLVARKKKKNHNTGFCRQQSTYPVSSFN
jgi:hypothetical protein